jgi:uncharacterized protein YndB with AHSA1/START domain
VYFVEHTVDSTAPPAAVWKVWEDFAERSRWDLLEWARLEGPVVNGTEGSWKPPRVPKLQIWLDDVVPPRRLTVVATHQRHVALMRYRHEVEPTAGGSRITLRVEVTGRMKWAISRLALRQTAKELDASLQRLAKLAEAETRAE